ncbi:MAG: hypothetical protein JO308_09595 [Verrucomicrobia bacterium]|nr:hypothetical protein [Verrucomicrobiota bacterium]
MKIVLQQIALICALIASLIWFVGQPLLFWSWTITQRLEIYSALILVFVSAVAISELIRAFERRQEQVYIKETAEGVQRLEKSKLSKLEFSQAPSTVAEYTEIWSGFTGHYYVYNPSYQVERKPGLDNNELVRDVFIPRFENPKLKKAHYLFLTGDELGKKDLIEFARLMRMVKAKLPKLCEKLEVRVLRDQPSEADAEVYQGNKGGQVLAIVKTKDKIFTGSRSNPLFYLVIRDEQPIKHLKDQFEQAWSRAESIDLFRIP